MRIIAGQWRGRTLATVGRGDDDAHLRPTTDRTRESLFNMLAGGRYGDPITGARVLDLFAGTGALALEALSRGGVHATFVDNGRIAQGLIRKNITLCGAKDTTLIATDATRLPANQGAGCNLIFLDPPYGKGLGTPALAAAQLGGWLAPQALIVCEDATETPAPPGLTRLDSRRYGDTVVTIMQAEAA
jgi:16S rRNA (guanine966-N2)-methyltransferase